MTTNAYKPTASLARNVTMLVDSATPYRGGQLSLAERAMYRRPGWHSWCLAVLYVVAGCLLAATWVRS